MITELKIMVKCPVTSEDVTFELQQSQNTFNWYMTDTRLSSGQYTTWDDIGDAIKNILTLSK